MPLSHFDFDPKEKKSLSNIYRKLNAEARCTQAYVKFAINLVNNFFPHQFIPVTGEPIVSFALNAAYLVSQINMNAHLYITSILSPLPCLNTPSFSVQVSQNFPNIIDQLFNELIKIYSQLSHPKVFLDEKKNTHEIILSVLNTHPNTDSLSIYIAQQLQSLQYLSQYSIDGRHKSLGYAGLKLYAPIATAIGLSNFKKEIENLSFYFLNSKTHYLIERNVMKNHKRFITIHNFEEKLRDQIHNTLPFLRYQIQGRLKSNYSIYKKMVYKSKVLHEIYDIHAIRIMVNHTEECYSILDLIYYFWPVLQKEFMDYILYPKKNSYQSIHVIVLTENWKPLEIQIRTKKMHEIAEYGVASHWKYKNDVYKNEELVPLVLQRKKETNDDRQGFIKSQQKEGEKDHQECY